MQKLSTVSTCLLDAPPSPTKKMDLAMRNSVLDPENSKKGKKTMSGTLEIVRFVRFAGVTACCLTPTSSDPIARANTNDRNLIDFRENHRKHQSLLVVSFSSSSEEDAVAVAVDLDAVVVTIDSDGAVVTVAVDWDAAVVALVSAAVVALVSDESELSVLDAATAPVEVAHGGKVDASDTPPL